MRQLYGCLLGALLPFAALAQTPAGAPDKEFVSYLTAHTSRPHLYVAAQAGTPVYLRELSKRGQTLDWGSVAGAVGVRLNAHWAAQVGFSRQSYSSSYEVLPRLSGPLPLTGSGHSSGAFTAVPVLVRYQLAPLRWPDFTLEGFAGLTPQWQQFASTEVAALPGQAPSETSTRARTTNLYATAGLAGVFGAGPGADVLVEVGANQRFYSRGDVNYAVAFAPTVALGFRYRFGSLPRRASYLAD